MSESRGMERSTEAKGDDVMNEQQISNLTHYPRQVSSAATLDLIKALQDILDFGRTYGFKSLDTIDGWEFLDSGQDALAKSEQELFPGE